MKTKISLKYLISSFSLILISFIIPYHFWWRIDLNSFQGFIIAISTGICLIGILYLSTFIISNFIFKNLEHFGFVSPFKLATNDFFYEKHGLPFAQKFKNSSTLISFPLLFFIILLFYFIVIKTEDYQLNKYGIFDKALIKNTFTDKRGKVANIVYEYNHQNYSKILILNDTLKKKGDYETIIFSSKNPYISMWKNEFEPQ